MREPIRDNINGLFAWARGILLLWFAAFVCGVVCGCGDGYPDTVKVSGHITLDGGDWPTGGKLYFNPIETRRGAPRRSGTAEFDTAGNFVVRSWAKKEGLVPGKYRVTVECWKVAPTISGPKPASYVAERFCAPALTPLEVVIDATSKSRQLELNVTSPAP